MSESQAASAEAQQVVEREITPIPEDALNSLADLVFRDEDVVEAEEIPVDHNGDPIIALENDAPEVNKEPVKEEKPSNSNILSLQLDKEKIQDLPSLLAALPEDLIIKHKFDGEVGEFSLKEAIEKVINNEAGMKTVHKKLTDVDKREKAWYNERQEYLKSVEDLKQTAQSGNMVGVSEKILGMLGYAPHTAKAQLLAELRPEFERLYTMSEDEIRNEQLKAENEYYSKQNETRAKQLSKEQALSELQKAVVSVKETHGIDDAEWSEAFNQLNKEIPPDQDFSYKDVAQKVLQAREQRNFDSKISSVFDGFESLPEAFVNEVVTFTKQNPQFSVEAIRDSVKKAISDAEATKRSQNEAELAKELKAKTTNKQPSQQQILEELEDLSSLVYRDED